MSMLVNTVLLLKNEGSHGGLTKMVTGAQQFFKVPFIKCHLIICPIKQISMQSLSGVFMSVLTFWNANF